jgi:hypothetical protein
MTSMTELPAETRIEGDLDDLIKEIYGTLHLPHLVDYFTNRTILATRNDDVDEINERILALFQGDEVVLPSVNSVVEDDLNLVAAGVPDMWQQRDEIIPVEGEDNDDNMEPEEADLEGLDAIDDEAAREEARVANQDQEQQAPPPPPPPAQQQGRYEGDPAHSPEFLSGLKIPGMPHGSLKVKRGVPVMLLRNLDPSNGLCNGTRLIILNIKRRVLEAQIITGGHSRTKVLIPHITLYSKKEDFGFVLSRRQFPVCLAFAMTINKSQGQSVAHVGVDLQTPAFAHGQLYVAMSRVTSASGIKVLFTPDEDNPHHTKTVNVVYKEVLLN